MKRTHIPSQSDTFTGRALGWFCLSLTIICSFSVRTGAQGALPPPVLNSFSPSSGPVGTAVTIQGDNLDQTSAVRFNTLTAEFTISNAHQVVASVPVGATNGPITVVTPGGTAVSTVSFTVADTLPPNITDLTPNQGPVGTEVTVTGEHLASATSVLFNGAVATFHPGFTGTELVATVPISGTSGPVTVITPYGTNTSVVSFTITTLPPPEITSFSPQSGPAGTRVAIEGNNLGNVTAVTFNGVSAVFTIFGNTLSAVVPDAANTGPITVSTPTGAATSPDSFFVTPPGSPVITGINPSSGRPGTTVAISGDNLGSVTGVNFNGTPATFTIFGPSVLFATVPADASSGLITIVSPSGATHSPGAFTVINPLSPEISGFSPNTGIPGTVISITGTNFTGATDVLFGGTSASFTIGSISQIQATVPPGASTGPIRVTTSQGTALSGENFFIPAQILSFSPGQGAVGSKVTIKGLSFTGAIAVQFAGANATFTNVSATEIQAVVPPDATSGAISIATPAGFAMSPGNFYLPPKIVSFDPPSAPPSSAVTVTGENLLDATRVQIGGVEAEIAAESPTSLVFVAPASGTSGPITITTPGGVATSGEPFYVGAFSDLVVGLSALPDSVGLGDFMSYTITLTNRGPLEAADTILTDRLPAGVQVIFGPSGAPCVQTNNVITCALGNIPAGAGFTVRMSVVIGDGPYLTNKVTVTSSTADPNPADNSASLLTILKGAPPPPGDEDVTLTAAATGHALTLSWPVTDGFVLESTSSLTPPVTWLPVDSKPVVVNGNSTVTVSTSTGTGFYRLRKPTTD